MGAFFETTEDIRKTVKITKHITLEVLDPFISTAKDIYLCRFIGRQLVDKLESDNLNADYTKLKNLCRLALGPLALWVGTSELSVRLSDAGFTVEKQDKFVPASDKKIEMLTESFERRGFQHLDAVLEYLETNRSNFPEWVNSDFYTLRGGNYIMSATQFQELGLIDIQYSRLTFESLRPLMSNIEDRFIAELLGSALDSRLRSKLLSGGNAAEKKLIGYIRKFVACKAAEVFTSEASKRNRTGIDYEQYKEYKPLIRPLYVDNNDTGNYCAQQAAYYYTKVQQTMNDNAAEFGIEVINEAVDFNNEERKIFFMG